MIGKVKRFINGRGYGFIGREDGPDVLFIIPQFKVSDIALYQKEIPSNLRSWGVPKAPKPPMSKENLTEHSCRKNEH